MSKVTVCYEQRGKFLGCTSRAKTKINSKKNTVQRFMSNVVLRGNKRQNWKKKGKNSGMWMKRLSWEQRSEAFGFKSCCFWLAAVKILPGCGFRCNTLKLTWNCHWEEVTLVLYYSLRSWKTTLGGLFGVHDAAMMRRLPTLRQSSKQWWPINFVFFIHHSLGNFTVLHHIVLWWMLVVRKLPDSVTWSKES